MPQKLHRLATVLFWVTTILVVLLPLSIGAALLFETPLPEEARHHFPNIEMSKTPKPLLFWLAMSGYAVGLMIFMGFLWQLRGLFDLYRYGHVLTLPAARLIQGLGHWLLALAVVQFLLTPFHSIILTLDNPAGERAIAISVSDHEIGFLLASGLLVLVGWAMKEAVAAAEENKAFV